jgi:hypothetical protein
VGGGDLKVSYNEGPIRTIVFSFLGLLGIDAGDECGSG